MTSSTAKPDYILPVSSHSFVSPISLMTTVQTRSTNQNGTGMILLRDASSRSFDELLGSTLSRMEWTNFWAMGCAQQT
jgi:hypothetical protein